jgi:xylitol oxidase
MRQHGDRLAPILMISELRTIAADNLWLSPAHRGPCLAIHFTFKRDWEAIQTILPAIEASLEPFGALPHWGKVTTMPPAAVMRSYGRLGDFRDLARAHDPLGKFRNEFVERYVFGEV